MTSRRAFLGAVAALALVKVPQPDTPRGDWEVEYLNELLTFRDPGNYDELRDVERYYNISDGRVD